LPSNNERDTYENGAGDVGGERAFDSWAVHVPFCGCQMDDKLPLLKLVFTHAAVSSSREEREGNLLSSTAGIVPHICMLFTLAVLAVIGRSLNNISRDMIPEVV
jgi:hypothetical protein